MSLDFDSTGVTAISLKAFSCGMKLDNEMPKADMLMLKFFKLIVYIGLGLLILVIALPLLFAIALDKDRSYHKITRILNGKL